MKKILSLVIVCAMIFVTLGIENTSYAAAKIQSNVSKSAVSANLSSKSLPTSVSKLSTGENYYFNLAGTTSNKFKSAWLYIKAPGSSSYSCAYSYTAKSYFRYTSYKTSFSKSGTLKYYWKIKFYNTGKTTSYKVNTLSVSGSSSSSSSSSGNSSSSSSSSSSIGLKQITPFTSTKTYAIRTATDWNKVVCVQKDSHDKGANIHIWQYYSDLETHHWNITYVGNGWYKIVNAATGKALDVTSGTAANYTNVIQWTDKESYNQLWKMYQAPWSGYVYLKSGVGDYYLDVYNRGTANGTNVDIYQYKSENPAQMFYLDEVSSSYIWPTANAYQITTLNYYWNNGTPKKHGTRWGCSHAVDIAGGGDILAVADGKVETVGWQKNGFGNYIVIEHSNGNRSLYGHLCSTSVKKGDSVKQGDKIGVMGSTGNSSGTHLHFELEDGNPMDYFRTGSVAKKLKIGTNVYKANNYMSKTKGADAVFATTADWIKENYTKENDWYVHN